MPAAAANKPVPAAPTLENPVVIKNAADYTGDYTSPDGQTITITGDLALLASVAGRQVPLQHSAGDAFIAVDPVLTENTFLFGRATGEHANNKDKPGPVVELMHGSRWYTNSRYTGPRTFTVPPADGALCGTHL